APDLVEPVDGAPDLPVVLPPRRRRFRWGALLWSALAGLVTLGLGVAVTNFVQDLFARSAWLGGVGMALTALAGLALLVIVVREVFGLVRLNAIEALRGRAAAAL